MAEERTLLGAGSSLAAAVRQSIHEATGLICSAGIASNKMLAKLASVRAKPNGMRTMYGTQVGAELRALPASHLPGCGGKAGALAWEQLRRGGAGCPRVQTAADVQGLTVPELAAHFGQAAAARIHENCFGRDAAPVVATRPPQSITSQLSLSSERPVPAATGSATPFLRDLAAELIGRLEHEWRTRRRVPRRLRVAWTAEAQGGARGGARSGSAKCKLPHSAIATSLERWESTGGAAPAGAAAAGAAAGSGSAAAAAVAAVAQRIAAALTRGLDAPGGEVDSLCSCAAACANLDAWQPTTAGYAAASSSSSSTSFAAGTAATPDSSKVAVHPRHMLLTKLALTALDFAPHHTPLSLRMPGTRPVRTGQQQQQQQQQQQEQQEEQTTTKLAKRQCTSAAARQLRQLAPTRPLSLLDFTGSDASCGMITEPAMIAQLLDIREMAVRRYA
jgi:hypothetical protein